MDSGVTIRAIGARPAVGEDLIIELTRALDSAASGLGFIYHALDLVRERLRASAVVLVVDDPVLGRQAYQCGRLPAEGWAAQICQAGPVGLHCDDTSVPTSLSEVLVHLASFAIRLDVTRHDARHDSLTGLLNRRAFDEVLDAACSQARRHGWSFALLLVDVNDFKTVNDVLGHARGDEVLRTIGSELPRQLRAGDAAARIGGDEFALVLPAGTLEVADVLHSRVEGCLRRIAPETQVGISIGAAVSPADGDTPDRLLAVADQRLYEFKRALRA